MNGCMREHQPLIEESYHGCTRRVEDPKDRKEDHGQEVDGPQDRRAEESGSAQAQGAQDRPVGGDLGHQGAQGIQVPHAHEQRPAGPAPVHAADHGKAPGQDHQVQSAKARKYYKKNKASILKNARARYQANKSKVSRYTKAYYKANKPNVNYRRAQLRSMRKGKKFNLKDAVKRKIGERRRTRRKARK